MKKLFLIAMLGLLASCGTIEGIGNDISGGARTVRNWF
ncbi:entericidin EcnA/B family protein [Thalassobius vesicularis]|uniref:Entericidin EcnA/B family protein n=1 Tax=Thalassobius vesicularis TaxID=1294297 RepID=A0A4S3MAH9_9RHOB|nr:entericidin EcnA/B family protein [Thalassobius vesicularis]THD74849.1 entericidin EcnA/B family protein [Thalassobius vesicularis]